MGTRQYDQPAHGIAAYGYRLRQVTEAPPASEDGSFSEFYMRGGVLYYRHADGSERNLADATVLPTEAGIGITAGSGTIYRSSVAKNGGIFTTRLLLDLTGLGSSTTDLDIIGVAGGPAHLGQITAARNGTILTGTMTCLEVPAVGADDIDLYAATEGTGVFDGGIAALAETPLITSGGAWTLGLTRVMTGFPAANQFLYLTGGEAGVPGTYTAGKFLIEMSGF